MEECNFVHLDNVIITCPMSTLHDANENEIIPMTILCLNSYDFSNFFISSLGVGLQVFSYSFAMTSEIGTF